MSAESNTVVIHVQESSSSSDSPSAVELTVEPSRNKTRETVTWDIDDDDESSSLSPPASPPRSTATVEILIHDALDTMPAVSLGRQLSMTNRARSAGINPRHNKPFSKSFHHRPSTESQTNLIRRSSSVPQQIDSAGFLQVEDSPFRKRSGGVSARDLHRSTRRLKDRIQQHREILSAKPVTAHDSVWSNFRHVKWPKIRSRLKVALAYELWKGHMKEVEGHFGTAVVSYFVFLRWLFFMNVVIFALWFGLVIIPQIVYTEVNDVPRTASLAACAFNSSLSPTHSCSSGTPAALFYGIPSNCDSPPGGFEIRRCEFDDEDGNGTLIASGESSSTLNVVPAADFSLMELNCTATDEGNGTDPVIEELLICDEDIAPFIPWYQYIFDFALGEGVFNDTVIFYGRYGNTTVVGDSYNLPLAFLLNVFAVYTISVLLIVYKMGRAYNESYLELSSKRKINFCNKLFTAWDFNITHSDTAQLKRAHIRTDFEEELADFERRNTKRTPKELAIVILIRILTNSFTLLVLLVAGVAIFFAAQFGLQNQANGLSLQGFVSPIVITTLNIVLPFLFSFLARFERFKTQSGEIKMTLLRAIVVRLSSLIVLIITLYIIIQCTQETMEQDSESEGECIFTVESINFFGANSSVAELSENCPLCWETFIGQEFYKLGLTNFIISAGSTFLVESLRNVASRVKYRGLGKKIGKGNFNIAKSILDLIYTQSLLWLGFIFCPLLPAIIMPTSFVLFYVKKYSLVWNLVPDKRGAFRATRRNFFYLFLLISALFSILLLIGFSVASLRPSPTCGPFRGLQYMYIAVTEAVNQLQCEVQQFFDFVFSVGFVLPIIVFLLLVIYAQYVTIKSRRAKFQLVKKQLILEGANVAHIVGKLDGVMQSLADQRAMMETDGAMPEQQPNLKERMQAARLSTGDTAQTTL